MDGLLEAINDELRTAFFRFAYQVDMMPSEDFSHTKNWVEIMNKVDELSKSALRELERDFRSLLGDDSLGQAF